MKLDRFSYGLIIFIFIGITILMSLQCSVMFKKQLQEHFEH